MVSHRTFFQMPYLLLVVFSMSACTKITSLPPESNTTHPIETNNTDPTEISKTIPVDANDTNPTEINKTTPVDANTTDPIEINATQTSPAGDSFLDSRTRLMWADDSEAGSVTHTFAHAVAYCEALNLGDHSDWRVPTMHELYTLVDYNRTHPAILGTIHHVSPSGYWSSDSYPLDPNLILGIDFEDGSDGISPKNVPQYVRCVRGEYVSSHSLSKVGDSVVDHTAHAEWQDTDETASRLMTYEEAHSYCRDLRLSDQDDWKIPTLRELRSIVDRAGFPPAIHQSFSHGNGRFYWTSTPYRADHQKVWTLLFADGNDYQAGKSAKAYIRCVR